MQAKRKGDPTGQRAKGTRGDEYFAESVDETGQAIGLECLLIPLFLKTSNRHLRASKQASKQRLSRSKAAFAWLALRGQSSPSLVVQ